MYRTGENMYHMDEDEQVVEAFMSWLMEERGKTFEEAEAILMALPDTVTRVLNGALATWIRDGELPPEPEPAEPDGA